MEQKTLFFRFGAALLIGILTGLQREFAAEEKHSEIAAGIRTFPLLALAGCTAALLCDVMGSAWPLSVTLLAVAGMLGIHYWYSVGKGDPGLTTKTSALLTVLAGALAYTEYVALAIAVGVTTMLLLSAKAQLHHFVHHLTKADVFATLKFAIITAIILPVLPNKIYGPSPVNVFNPFKIWLLVVFISGISFVGYILTKTMGSRKGIRLTGLLGGLASSTAVTLSITQLSREHKNLAKPFASSIIIAWTIMFIRVVIIVCAFNFPLVKSIWLPISAALAAGFGWYVFLFLQEKSEHQNGDRVRLTNPFELGTAIKFGILFSIILAVAKSANHYLGTAGTYISSFVSGLADVDAIVLSITKFSGVSAEISMDTAARAIIIACVANTLVKGGIVLFGGSRELKKAIWPGWLLIMAASVAAMFAF
jgi:uncharacterized membrane protein (DUF4010 family)